MKQIRTDQETTWEERGLKNKNKTVKIQEQVLLGRFLEAWKVLLTFTGRSFQSETLERLFLRSNTATQSPWSKRRARESQIVQNVLPKAREQAEQVRFHARTSHNKSQPARTSHILPWGGTGVPNSLLKPSWICSSDMRPCSRKSGVIAQKRCCNPL